MNVMISVNQRAFTGAEVVIYSLMRYHKNVHWYVTTMEFTVCDTNNNCVDHIGINQMHFHDLEKIVKYFDSDSTIELIDTTEYYMQYLACGPNDFTPFTPYTSIRLFSDLILPEDEHDLLYLDVDTLVCQNIDAEYKKYTSIDGPYAAYSIIEACDYKGEMVAGILFFNMDICRKTKFFETARKYYKTNEYKFPDQMAIRDTADPVDMDKSLNYMWPLDDAEEPIKIIHFTNRLSPKVYSVPWERFFQKFPQFKDIKEGIELINSLDLKIIN